MEITILSDNNSSGKLQAEHGLSILIRHGGQSILLDTGASDIFIKNAGLMGIQIADVDKLILSHGHNDHTGGLKYFLAKNLKAEIYISSEIKDKKFYSLKNNLKRDISTDNQLIIQNSTRFTFIHNTTLITPQMALVCKFENKYPQPKANQRLIQSDKENESPDNFIHEIALAVNTPEGIVIFSGCCHNGLLNILISCSSLFPQKEIISCIGGTHLIDNYETIPEIKKAAYFIKENYPQLKLYTGHCTGEYAAQTLSKILERNFVLFHAGYTFNI